jgi:hypothetical protein
MLRSIGRDLAISANTAIWNAQAPEISREVIDAQATSLAPFGMHNAAQAEYVRSAAQAYPPGR